MKTIFVSIASYRDKLCSSTIKSLFDNAKHPQRVYVGICEQNKEEDTPCVYPEFKSNIRYSRLPSSEAQGPAYARYLCSLLYQNEDFFFQIDSHCLCVKNWDQKCIDMMTTLEKETNNSKIILSHYPKVYEDYEAEPDPKSEITMIKKGFLNEKGIISFFGANFVKPEKLPMMSYFIAAGFIFAPRQFIVDVPFDPHLPNLFTGEEILLTLRAFTNGYDVYTPNRDIVYHFYTRQNEPKFWDHNYTEPKDAERKVKVIIGQDNESTLSKIKDHKIRDSVALYGLGNVRTRDEFFKKVAIQWTADEGYHSFGSSSGNSIHQQSVFLCICLILFVSLGIFLLYELSPLKKVTI